MYTKIIFSQTLFPYSSSWLHQNKNDAGLKCEHGAYAPTFVRTMVLASPDLPSSFNSYRYYVPKHFACALLLLGSYKWGSRMSAEAVKNQE